MIKKIKNINDTLPKGHTLIEETENAMQKINGGLIGKICIWADAVVESKLPAGRLSGFVGPINYKE